MADCRIKLLDHPKSHQCALVEMKGNTIRLQMWVKNDGFTEGQVAKGHELAFFISNKDTKESLMVAGNGNYKLTPKFLEIDVTVFGTDANFVKLTKASKLLVETKSIFLKPQGVQFVKFSATFNVHEVLLKYEGLGLDTMSVGDDEPSQEEAQEDYAATPVIPNNAIADALRKMVDKSAQFGPKEEKPVREPSSLARRMAAIHKSKEPTPVTVTLPSGKEEEITPPSFAEYTDTCKANMVEVFCSDGTDLSGNEEHVVDFLNRMNEVFPGSSVEERLAYAMFAVKQVKTMTAIASKMEPGK